MYVSLWHYLPVISWSCHLAHRIKPYPIFIFPFLSLSGYNPSNKCFQFFCLPSDVVSTAADDLTVQILLGLRLPQVASSQNLRKPASLKVHIFPVAKTSTVFSAHMHFPCTFREQDCSSHERYSAMKLNSSSKQWGPCHISHLQACTVWPCFLVPLGLGAQGRHQCPCFLFFLVFTNSTFFSFFFILFFFRGSTTTTWKMRNKSLLWFYPFLAPCDLWNI